MTYNAVNVNKNVAFGELFFVHHSASRLWFCMESLCRFAYNSNKKVCTGFFKVVFESIKVLCFCGFKAGGCFLMHHNGQWVALFWIGQKIVEIYASFFPFTSFGGFLTTE